jgi:hypothetical protein
MTATRLDHPNTTVPLWESRQAALDLNTLLADESHNGRPPSPADRLQPPPPSGNQQQKPDIRPSTVLYALGPGLGLVAGTALLCVAYSWAATRPPGNLEFLLFWLGELAAIVPLAARLSRDGPSRSQRLALVAAAGLFSFVPKFLRDPSAPLFHDELVHWHEAQAVFQAGHPFVPSTLISLIQYFPGLATLTASLQNLTGLSTFQVGTVLLWLLHLLALIGVFVLVERLTNSSRAAGIAGLVYAVSPAFMFFDAQFSYESLAIVFFIWVLVCIVELQAAGSSTRQQGVWFVVGLILALACVVTHHVTTYALVLALVAISVATTFRRRRDSQARHLARLTWAFTGTVASAAAAWLVFVAPGTLNYLAPHLKGGVTGLLDLVRGGTGPRSLFQGSSLPGYERAAAFLTPVVLLLVVAFALWRIKGQRHRLPPALLGLAAFGLLYFLSLPVMLTAESEGARRSWTFTYVGLAVLIGALSVDVGRRFDGSRRRRFAFAAAVTAVLVVLLVGNVSVQTNVDYRFPGPYVYGSDTRSLTTELLSAAAWLRTEVGPGQRIVTTRDDGLAFGTIGDQLLAAPSTGFPVWELYFSTAQPSPNLLDELRAAKYGYLVVDDRMARFLPEVGFYFEPSEPPAAVRTHPPPQAALTKVDALPWLTRIYSTDHLRIYRFDFTEVGACPWGSRLAVAVLACLAAHR